MTWGRKKNQGIKKLIIVFSFGEYIIDIETKNLGKRVA